MSNLKSRLGAAIKGERLSSAVLTAIIIGLVIVVNVIVFILDSYFGLYLYSPATTDMSISGSMDGYFEKAAAEGKKVKISFCRAEDEVKSNSAGQFVLQTAEKFAERYPDFISLDFINIVRKVNAKGEYVDLSKYQTENADGVKSPLLKSSVIFECGDNVKVVTDGYSSTGYSDFFTLDSSGNAYAYNGEEVIASMVMWVMRHEHKTAYFTTFHGETADYGLRNMLLCAGYNVDTLDIRNNEIPSDAGMILISNPVNDFERAQEGSNVVAEIERLREYMQNGGNLYVAIDPYGQTLPVLEAFIAEFGITISYSEREGSTARNIVRDSESAITTDFYTLVASCADNDLGNALSETFRKYTDANVIVRESAALKLDESLGASPILLTSAASELYSEGVRTDNSGKYCVSAISRYENDDGAVGSMVVVPGIYLTSTDALTSGGYANREFVYAMIDEIFGAEDVPYGCNTVFYSQGILENLTMSTARLYTVFILAIPVVIAAAGAFVVIRRKNR